MIASNEWVIFVNIVDRLNFLTCEQTLLDRKNILLERVSILLVFTGAKLFIQCNVTIYIKLIINIINKYLKYFRDVIVQNDLPLFAIYPVVNYSS